MNARSRQDLEAAIDQALKPFIGNDLVPGTARAIVVDVTNYAEVLIDIVAGDPEAARPQGILYAPRSKQ